MPGPGKGSATAQSDAAYSTVTKKYYLITSLQTWGGTNTWIKLFESSDAINWKESMTIDELGPNCCDSGQSYDGKPYGGFQYLSIVADNMEDNGVVTDRFYIYTARDPGTNDHQGLLQYRVFLNTNSHAERSSDHFSNSQKEGDSWSYKYQTESGIYSMNWDENVWRGNEEHLQLRKGGGHPGENSNTVLEWKAPKAGKITLLGTLFDLDYRCGDGVMGTIHFKDETVWAGTINNNDGVGVSHSLILEVKTDDRIQFIISKKGNAFCDASGWDPFLIYWK